MAEELVILKNTTEAVDEFLGDMKAQIMANKDAGRDLRFKVPTNFKAGDTTYRIGDVTKTLKKWEAGQDAQLPHPPSKKANPKIRTRYYMSVVPKGTTLRFARAKTLIDQLRERLPNWNVEGSLDQQEFDIQMNKRHMGFGPANKYDPSKRAQYKGWNDHPGKSLQDFLKKVNDGWRQDGVNATLLIGPQGFEIHRGHIFPAMGDTSKVSGGTTFGGGSNVTANVVSDPNVIPQSAWTGSSGLSGDIDLPHSSNVPQKDTLLNSLDDLRNAGLGSFNLDEGLASYLSGDDNFLAIMKRGFSEEQLAYIAHGTEGTAEGRAWEMEKKNLEELGITRGVEEGKRWQPYKPKGKLNKGRILQVGGVSTSLIGGSLLNPGSAHAVGQSIKQRDPDLLRNAIGPAVDQLKWDAALAAGGLMAGKTLTGRNLIRNVVGGPVGTAMLASGAYGITDAFTEGLTGKGLTERYVKPVVNKYKSLLGEGTGEQYLNKMNKRQQNMSEIKTYLENRNKKVVNTTVSLATDFENQNKKEETFITGGTNGKRS